MPCVVLRAPTSVHRHTCYHGPGIRVTDTAVVVVGAGRHAAWSAQASRPAACRRTCPGAVRSRPLATDAHWPCGTSQSCQSAWRSGPWHGPRHIGSPRRGHNSAGASLRAPTRCHTALVARHRHSHRAFTRCTGGGGGGLCCRVPRHAPSHTYDLLTTNGGQTTKPRHHGNEGAHCKHGHDAGARPRPCCSKGEAAAHSART